MPPQTTGLAEVFLQSLDPRLIEFLQPTLRTLPPDPTFLSDFGVRWYQDPRPDARTLLHRFLNEKFIQRATPGGFRGFVKRIFKLAEAAQDIPTLAHFLVAFDLLHIRNLKTRHLWDPATQKRVAYAQHKLVWTPSRIRGTQRYQRPPDWKRYPHLKNLYRPTYEEGWGARPIENRPQFTTATRRYLQRRAWRFFRIQSKTSPFAYTQGIGLALSLYPPIETAEKLLDCWALGHICYHHSPELIQRRSGWEVKGDLQRLSFAPYRPELWQEPSAYSELLPLLSSANALIRQFACTQLLSNHQNHHQIPLQSLLDALESIHPEVQQFALQALAYSPKLDAIPLSRWLELFHHPNPTCGTLAAAPFLQNPPPITPAQALLLARCPIPTIVRYALTCLEQPGILPDRSWLDLARPTGHPAPEALFEATGLAIRRLSPLSALELRELFDSPHAQVRKAVIEALGLAEKPAATQPDLSLYTALLESPYPEVRSFLIHYLHHHIQHIDLQNLPLSPLTRMWATTLLAIGRGSRDRVRVLGQLAEQWARSPTEQRADLSRLLLLSLRSVQVMDRRAAILILTRAAERDTMLVPELEKMGLSFLSDDESRHANPT